VSAIQNDIIHVNTGLAAGEGVWVSGGPPRQQSSREGE